MTTRANTIAPIKLTNTVHIIVRKHCLTLHPTDIFVNPKFFKVLMFLEILEIHVMIVTIILGIPN